MKSWSNSLSKSLHRIFHLHPLKSAKKKKRVCALRTENVLGKSRWTESYLVNPFALPTILHTKKIYSTDFRVWTHLFVFSHLIYIPFFIHWCIHSATFFLRFIRTPNIQREKNAARSLILFTFFPLTELAARV